MKSILKNGSLRVGPTGAWIVVVLDCGSSRRWDTPGFFLSKRVQHHLLRRGQAARQDQTLDHHAHAKPDAAFDPQFAGKRLGSDHNVIAEPKHFAAHGSPESGLNTAPVHAGEREVRSIMLKLFEPAIREGKALGIMAAYHDLDGIPCTSNPWLLNKVLRQEWGFQGFGLSDLGAIRRLYATHHVVDSPAHAVCLALNSGVDMQFCDFDHATFQNAIIEGVNRGKLSAATLDAAVSRLLRAKLLLGLFDHPFMDEALQGSRKAMRWRRFTSARPRPAWRPRSGR